MSDDQAKPKQKTPKGHEIPVPKREDVFRDLKKVAPPDKQDRESEERKDEGR